MGPNIEPEVAELRRRSIIAPVGLDGYDCASRFSEANNTVATSGVCPKYIVAFDFGSTNIKACCFDTCRVQLVLSTEIAYEYETEPTVSGLNEINSAHLLSCFQRVLEAVFTTTAIDGVPDTIQPDDIECVAFTGQRNSFITWHADTGRPFHQFISWKNDKPERQYTRRWNANYFLRIGRSLARAVHSVSGSQRMYIMSNFYFMSKQVLPRLKWCIDRIPELRHAMSEGKARIGGIETWVTWRLSRGERFIIDKTFACGTGLFQPVQMCWSFLLRFLFRIPRNMLPTVVDSCTHRELAHCYVDHIRGERGERCWPLKAMCEDQQAAMFAALEYNLPQKITLGTGSFFNALVGPEPIYDQNAGIYPLRACCLPNTDGRNWIAEASLPPLGEIMTWALEHGLTLDADFLPLQWRTAPYFDLKSRKFVEHENFRPVAESAETVASSTSSRLDADEITLFRKNNAGRVFLTLEDMLHDRNGLSSRLSSIELCKNGDDENCDIRTMTNAQQKAANDRQRKSARADVDVHEALLRLDSIRSVEKSSSMRRHILAWSVLEGCAFALYEDLLRIRRRIPFDEKLAVDGGVSNNPLLLRSLSTLLGIPLVKYACTNGSALGVALLAFFSRERDSLVDKMRDMNSRLNKNNSNNRKSFDIFGLRQQLLNTRRSLSGQRSEPRQHCAGDEIDDAGSRERMIGKSASSSPVRNDHKHRKYFPSYSYDFSEQFVIYEPDKKMADDLHDRYVQWTRIFRSNNDSNSDSNADSRRALLLQKNVKEVISHCHKAERGQGNAQRKSNKSITIRKSSIS